MSCPICKSNNSKSLFKAKDCIKTNEQEFNVIKCLNCDIIFTSIFNFDFDYTIRDRKVFWRRKANNNLR